MPADRSPGFRFKEGKLFVFTETGVIILETWPVLRAVRKLEGKSWEEFSLDGTMEGAGKRSKGLVR